MAVTRSRTGKLPPKSETGCEDASSEDESDSSYGFNGRKSKSKSVRGKSNRARKVVSVNPEDRKLPSYKVEQLKKISKLLRMSNVAKPRSLVGEYGTFSGSTSLKISEDSKYKISSLTNYNVIRDQIIMGVLDESEMRELEKVYERNERLRSIKVKDLSKDKYLKMALNSLKSQRRGLRTWKSGDIDFKKMKKDDVLGLNEIGVNLLGLEQNHVKILERNKEHNKKIDITTKADTTSGMDIRTGKMFMHYGNATSTSHQLLLGDSQKIASMQMVGRKDTMFHPIDVEAIKSITELSSLKTANYNGNIHDDPYRGLDPEDYTKVKEI